MVSSGGGDPPCISSGVASSVATGVGGAPRFRAGLRSAALARLAGGRRLAAGRRLAFVRRFPVVRRFEVARRFVADTVKCLPITRLSLLAARSPLFAENNGDQLDSAGQAIVDLCRNSCQRVLRWMLSNAGVNRRSLTWKRKLKPSLPLMTSARLCGRP